MITDKQAADIAEWNEARDTARGFIRELLADRAERVRIEAELRAATAEHNAVIYAERERRHVLLHCPITDSPAFNAVERALWLAGEKLEKSDTARAAGLLRDVRVEENGPDG